MLDKIWAVTFAILTGLGLAHCSSSAVNGGADLKNEGSEETPTEPDENETEGEEADSTADVGSGTACLITPPEGDDKICHDFSKVEAKYADAQRVSCKRNKGVLSQSCPTDGVVASCKVASSVTYFYGAGAASDSREGCEEN